MLALIFLSLSWRMADYLPKRRSAMLMDWLCTATPDQWHQVAMGWNWGSGEAPLRWIVSQPDCDKATALMVFWRGQPSYYWNGPPTKAEWKASGRFFSEDVYDLLTFVVNRWRSGGYTRSEIGYLPEGGDASDLAASQGHPALAIPPDMGEELKGRRIDGGEFDEGIPFPIVIETAYD
jgi:hypothetical protein